MTERELSVCASLVRRDDPDLFYAALFAREPARERLMVLYAFDLELSRAQSRATESTIALMRLQWWRDVVEEICAGRAPRAHEVAGPLHRLLSETDLDQNDLERMILAHENEIEGLPNEAAVETWADARFGALGRLGAQILEAPERAQQAIGPAAQAQATAYLLRHAIKMAAQGGAPLIPGLDGEDRAKLAVGETTVHAAEIARSLARKALDALRTARGIGRGQAAPLFLPLWRAEHLLKQADRLDLDFARHLVPPRGRVPAYLWRAMTGRW